MTSSSSDIPSNLVDIQSRGYGTTGMRWATWPNDVEGLYRDIGSMGVPQLIGQMPNTSYVMFVVRLGHHPHLLDGDRVDDHRQHTLCNTLFQCRSKTVESR
jgi:hypothetical protein